MGLLDGRGRVVTGGGSGIGRRRAGGWPRRARRSRSLDIDGDARQGRRRGDRRPRVRRRRHRLRRAVEAAVPRRGDAARRAHDPVQQRRREQHGRRCTTGTSPSGTASSRLNLTGVFHGIKAAVPLMLDTSRRRRRAIVSTASISGTRPSGRRGALLGGQGRGRRAHRDCRARVRARHPGERGVAGDDPHRAHRHPAHRIDWTVPHMVAKTPLGPHRHARGHRRRRRVPLLRSRPVRHRARTSSSTAG